MLISQVSQDWDLHDLATLLEAEAWQAADRVTQSLLLASVNQSQVGHFSALTLAQVPCQMLHELDYLWVRASQGNFGFSVQQRLYHQMDSQFDPTQPNWLNPHPFFQQVGWLMVTLPRPLAFFKFYDFLNFSLDAPPGHLPALWYWQLSWLDSLKAGGFGTGRGGGFADLARLDALMLRMGRCDRL
ncbi:MAG: GUN4 domain-containing protein [Nodosilinea sp.]